MTTMQFLKSRSLAQLAGIGMIVAGIAAFGYQATKNAAVASRFSTGWMAYVDAIGGAAVELFVAAAAIGIISLANRGKVQSKRALGGLMALCVCFGVFAASQQINVGRAEKSADQGLNQSNLAARQAEQGRLQAELATMGTIPAVLTAQGALDKLKTRKGWAETKGCAEPGRFSVLCRQVADANAMIGRAKRKEAVEASLASISTKNEGTSGKQVAAADPMAELIAGQLGLSLMAAMTLIAVFNACTMMLLGMFGVHFGLIVYGMEHEAAAAQPTAEIIHPQFAQPRTPTPIDGSRTLIEAARAKMAS